MSAKEEIKARVRPGDSDWPLAAQHSEEYAQPAPRERVAMMRWATLATFIQTVSADDIERVMSRMFENADKLEETLPHTAHLRRLAAAELERMRQTHVLGPIEPPA